MSVQRRRLLRTSAAVWAAASSLLLSGCDFDVLYDVYLPGGASTGDDAYRVTV